MIESLSDIPPVPVRRRRGQEASSREGEDPSDLGQGRVYDRPPGQPDPSPLPANEVDEAVDSGTGKREGGSLKLLGVPKRIESILMVTKLNTIFDSYGDEEDALRSFGS